MASRKTPALPPPTLSIDDPPTPVATSREALETDRVRLLEGVVLAHQAGDFKAEAALQSQLNGVNRMLLRITGETAPTDASLVKSPQFGRFMARLCDELSKKHPAAWKAVLRMASET